MWDINKELGDYTYPEIPEELNLPVSSVRSLLAHVRKTLMREMQA
jgi:DNA-directed RNA polymerase specialized sigma24 family protein